MTISLNFSALAACRFISTTKQVTMSSMSVVKISFVYCMERWSTLVVTWSRPTFHQTSTICHMSAFKQRQVITPAGVKSMHSTTIKRNVLFMVTPGSVTCRWDMHGSTETASRSMAWMFVTMTSTSLPNANVSLCPMVRNVVQVLLGWERPR